MGGRNASSSINSALSRAVSSVQLKIQQSQRCLVEGYSDEPNLLLHTNDVTRVARRVNRSQPRINRVNYDKILIEGLLRTKSPVRHKCHGRAARLVT